MKIYQLFLALVFMLLVAGTFAQQEEAAPSFLQTQDTNQMTNLAMEDEDSEDDEEDSEDDEEDSEDDEEDSEDDEDAFEVLAHGW